MQTWWQQMKIPVNLLQTAQVRFCGQMCSNQVRPGPVAKQVSNTFSDFERLWVLELEVSNCWDFNQCVSPKVSISVPELTLKTPCILSNPGRAGQVPNIHTVESTNAWSHAEIPKRSSTAPLSATADTQCHPGGGHGPKAQPHLSQSLGRHYHHHLPLDSHKQTLPSNSSTILVSITH